MTVCCYLRLIALFSAVGQIHIGETTIMPVQKIKDIGASESEEIVAIAGHVWQQHHYI